MRRFLAAVIPGLIIAIIATLALVSNIIPSRYQHALTDRLYNDQSKGISPAITVVAIDEKSIKDLGTWPFSRTVYVDLFKKIHAANPKVIGLDVAFSEHSQNPEADVALVNAIKEIPELVIPVEIENLARNGGTPSQSTFKLPFSELSDVAKKAYVNTPLDGDSIFRALPTSVGGSTYSAFSLTLLTLYGHPVASTQITADYLYPRFTKEPARVYSLTDVLANRVAPDAFTDRIVLIGATASNLHDEQPTPLSTTELMPGVLIHANIIKSILEGTTLAPIATNWMILILFVLALIVSVLVYRLRPIFSAILSLIILIAYTIIAALFFDRGIIVDLLYPLLVVMLSYIVSLAFKLFHEERQKSWIKKAFGHYLAPDVIEQLLAHPEKLKLGGQRKEMSIMFSDIRNFTSLSEKMDAEDLVKLLNTYLTRVTTSIIEQKGTVDKYIGDAVMAFWNAPLDDKDHAVNACHTALIMLEIITTLKKEIDAPIDIGVGINSGEVVVGNIGSTQRFDYTVIGDNVNLASRLEGLCKTYGVRIVISEHTKKLIGEHFITRKLDNVAVKGKEKPVVIYELVAAKSAKIPEFVTAFEQGLEYYFDQQWSKAIVSFKAVLTVKPDDKSAQLFIARSEEYTKNPPEKGWSGAYIAKEK